MKKTIYIIGLIILSGLILFILPLWNVETINISGYNKYTQGEIESAVGYKPGKHILSYNIENMEYQLKQMPYIKEVEIKRRFPNQMHIQVKERKPIAYVTFLDTLLCIDEEGYVLKQVKVKQEELPIVEGIEYNSFTVGQKMTMKDPQKMSILKEVNFYLEKYDFIENVDIIELTNINQIHLYVNKLDVIIGNMRDFDEKVKWLVEVHKDFPMGILDLSLITYEQAVLKPLN